MEGEIMEDQIKTIISAILTTFPYQANKGQKMPYAILKSDKISECKTLSGFTGLYDQSFEVEIIDSTVKSATAYFNLIRTAIKAIERTTQTRFIQSVSIDENAPMLVEPEINGFRKILSFTISYQI
jgi:hypothetical protein